VAAIGAATITAQQRCRALALTCRFVDLRFADAATLRATRVLILPPNGIGLPFIPSVADKLRTIRGSVRIVAGADAALRATPQRAAQGIEYAALLVAPGGASGILDIINPETKARRIAATTFRLDDRAVAVRAFIMPPRSAHDVYLNVPRDALRAATAARRRCCAGPAPRPAFAPRSPLHGSIPGTTDVRVEDFFADGDLAFVLTNRYVRVIVSPGAGARSFVFEDLATRANAFTSIGALRDDVASPLPPSARDYIAAYTHPMPAGTFNRRYACAILERSPVARVRCTYDAPDLAASPVHFEKTFTLSADTRTLAVEMRASSDAASISAVASGAAPEIACPDIACKIVTKAGYRLVTLQYPVGGASTIRFTLPGAAPASANPP
ncbi:MAG TPA: hypothetical protein VIJ12_10030, partial [Candidatus Baltobacteraceae bacterium]